MARTPAEMPPGGLALKVLENLVEGCQVIGPDFRYLYVNDAVAEHARRPKEQLLGRTMMEVYPGIEATEMFAALRRCMEERTPRCMENEFTYADGVARWFELRLEPVPEGVVILSLDISVRKLAAAREAHLKAVLHAIRNVNQLITQERDQATLLRRACDVLTETRGYHSAWIGLGDGHGVTRVVAHAGLAGEAAALAAQLEGGEVPACCRRALAEPGAVAVHRPTPECEGCALVGVYRDSSVLAAALRLAGRVHGVLVVSLPASLADDAEEQSLFLEVAGDLGFALHAMELERGRCTATVALQQSEERFRAVVEQAPDGIFIQTRGCFAYLNPAAVSLFGAADERQLLGRPVAEMFHPDRRAMVLERIRRLNEGREIVGPAEQNIVRRDGSEVVAELSAVPFLHCGEHGALVFARDLTARRRAEAALQASRAKLEAALASMTDAVFISDAAGQFLDFNEGFATFHRFRNKQECARTLAEYPEILDVFMADGSPLPLDQWAVPRALRGETARDAEYTLRRKDTGETWVGSYSFAPLRDEAGAITGAVVVGRDITAQRLAAAALRESEERFRSLVDAAPDGIYVQAGGRVRFVNPAMVGLVGAARAEDLIGMALEALVAPEFLEAVRRRIQEQRASGRPVAPMDQEYVRRDGTRIPVETSAVPIRFQGEDAHLVFARDCTVRRLHEADRRDLQAQLEQSQKLESIGRLAGGIAHDFNNLLSVIISYAGFAAEEVRESDPLHQDLVEIQGAANRAAALTRQLLAFSRKQILQPEVISLNQVVAGVEGMLRRLLGEDVDILVHRADDLGSVMADPGQIEQVLVNLAVNARDAMPGGGKLTIETANVELDGSYADRHHAVKPGRYVTLSVSDTGTGMDATTRQHIFEPFFTTKEKGKGTGLGLSTVYGIVAQSGGHVGVYSEPGRGSTFRVYLPREDEPAAAARPKPAPVATGGSETVLLVEDEEAVRKVAARILQSAGYTPLVAASGGDALILAERHAGPIDLLLTDVVMPQLSGPELAARLARLRPKLKVLYMSGYTDSALGHHGVLDPGTRFVAKPFAATELMRKVREALDED